ncbi:uncharacterized protein LOC111109852 [Crassostrea virginica]
MNPNKSAQDVLRCHLCETPVPPLCCEICHIYLCKVCVADHVLDETTEHKVVSIKQTLSTLLYPKCLNHSSKNCELYCDQCTIPICVQCASSKKHRGHRFKDLLECVERKREASQTDLQELESSILIEHKEFASCIRNQKANLDKNLEEVNRAIDEHGEKLHKQVSDVVEKFKSDIVKKHERRIVALTKTEEQNALSISDIEKCILGVQELQSSRDLGLVFEYKSRNEELRKTPPNLNVTLPTFVAYDITNDKLDELFGSLTTESDDRKTMEHDVKSIMFRTRDVERDEFERRKSQIKINKAILNPSDGQRKSPKSEWGEYNESASKSAAKTRDTDVDFSAVNSPWASPNPPTGHRKSLKSEWGGV